MEKTFLCESRELSTEVVVDRSFAKLVPFLSSRFKDTPRLLCVDERIPASYIEELETVIAKSATNFWVWKVVGGEQMKTREMKGALEDWCLSRNVGGDACVIAIGGGALLDLVGFFASTYARGLPLILVPSTVLAMSDASFGGKNGINARGVKNIIGTVWHPTAIFNNLLLLQHLTPQQRSEGSVEIFKHALISSGEETQRVLSLWTKCAEGDLNALEEVISRSVEVKADITLQSCDDCEIRHLLNLGHTVGHAVESLEETLSHGMAVAIGLWVESVLGSRRGITSKDVVSVMENLLEQLSCRKVLSKKWTLQEWEHVMQRDKKNIVGAPCVVLLQDIGVPYCYQGRYRVPLTAMEVSEAYELVQRFFV